MPTESATEPARYAAMGTVDDGLVTGEAVALDVRPTSFVLRGAGAAIDFLVYIGLYVLITAGTYFFADIVLFDDAIGAAIGVAALVISLVVTPTVVELASHGRSLGKRVVGARIVRDDGGAIGFRHAFVRSLTGVLEIFLTIGGFAAIVGLLSEKSKRMGDYLAGTYSQYERVSRKRMPVAQLPAELSGWAEIADVARMPDQLARRMTQFLAQSSALSSTSRLRLAEQLAAEASVHVSPVPDVQPELFITAVVVKRRERELAALVIERERLELLTPVLAGLPHAFPHRG
jgi:uncharacterized RDD family membrane protein YckC